MKPLRLISIFCFLLIAKLAIGQLNVNLDSLFSNQNFAVPDLPAFNALEIEPGNLLRPSSPRDFSIVASEFFNLGSIVIPKSMAVEVAPIVLMRKNKLTLEDYQKTPILYNTRVSVGTLRDSLNVSRVAIGFRTTIINKGDIKGEKRLAEVVNFLRDKNASRNEFLDNSGYNNFHFAENPSLADSLNREFDKLYAEKEKRAKDILDLKTWNEERLDFAIALVGSSQDSIAENINFNSLHVWLAYGHPLGSNAQLLVGTNLRAHIDNKSYFFDFSLPVRAYVGTNTLKGFAEGQYVYKQNIKTNNFIVRLGCEYHIYKGFWLDFSAGLMNNYTMKTSTFTGNIKLFYAITNGAD